MYAYIIRRILLMIPTLIGVITVTFVISEYVPGGPLDQVRAMLEGRTGANAGAEVTAANFQRSKLKRKVDPKLEWKLKRIYGLNHSALTRYLRTILWFGRDSIISSREIDSNSAEKFSAGGIDGIILRLNDNYYAYVNNWHGEEVVYEPETGCFRSIGDNALFDGRTGKRLNGSGNLRKLPIQIVSSATVTEIYLKEGFWQAVSNFHNWHGFFLLKFGNSIIYNKTVLTLIKERLPVSASLGIFSFLITYTICILLGIAKAVRNGTPFDTMTSVVILFGYSIPGFVLAVLLIVYFGPGDKHIIDLIPLSGLTSSALPGYANWSLWRKVADYLHHLAAPLLCLSIGSFAVLTMLTKNSILEEIHQLYAVAARARGLSEKKVLFKHILRNSLIPLITGFPSSFLMMFFTGALLIEKIFSLDGLGLLGYSSIMDRDFPVIMGSLFIFTLLGLSATLIRDICYVIVDPRITYDKK